jgi:hypothetical protein
MRAQQCGFCDQGSRQAVAGQGREGEGLWMTWFRRRNFAYGK